MSIYVVAMWSVTRENLAEHDTKALPALLDHIKAEHPRILSARSWAVRFGGEPARFGRILMEEYPSFTGIDQVEALEHTPGCDEVWDRVHALVIPGTFRTAVWTDPLKPHWKETPLR